jgi:hypothetical protein
MHTKINLAWAEASLSRILDAFEQEILEISEEEIMEAAKELGMKPDMKGSAAFIDLKYAFGIPGEDVCEMHAWSSALDERMASEGSEYSNGESPAWRELQNIRHPKDPDDK